MEAAGLPHYLDSLLRRHNFTLAPDRAEPIIYPKRPEEYLYPGAHIATGNEGEAYHHGIVIDITGDMTIVHFWGEAKQDAKIQKTTLNAFLAGHPNKIGKKIRPLYLIVYTGDTEEKRLDTVYNAKVLLTRADQYTYNLISRNCEALACFCRTGQWISEQVERVKKLLATEIHEKVQSWFETKTQQYPSLMSITSSGSCQGSDCSTVNNSFGSFSGTIDALSASSNASCSLNSLKSGQDPANHS